MSQLNVSIVALTTSDWPGGLGGFAGNWSKAECRNGGLNPPFNSRADSAYAGRISLSEAASRKLRLPASAMPSSSPLSDVQIPEKPIPTS